MGFIISLFALKSASVCQCSVLLSAQQYTLLHASAAHRATKASFVHALFQGWMTLAHALLSSVPD